MSSNRSTVNESFCSVFIAELNNFRKVYDVLKSINFKEFAKFVIAEEGLKIIIEDTKNSPIIVYLPIHVFLSYSFDSANSSDNEAVQFSLSLKVLTECLNIFGDEHSCSLKLHYKAYGYPLKVILEQSESGIIVDCEIKTLEVNIMDEFDLDNCHSDANQTIVVNGPKFANLINYMDTGTETFQMSISDKSPFFTIKTTDALGESLVTISKDASLVTNFHCNSTLSSNYSCNLIRQLSKPLQLSKETSITITNQCLLIIQSLFDTDDKQVFFVEFYLSPLVPNLD